jgi:hypothetical protein
MRISYPPIVVGTVVAVALAAGVAGSAQAKSDIPAHKADAQVVDGGALAVRKPIKPVEPVVLPVEGVDKGGWSNDPYLT